MSEYLQVPALPSSQVSHTPHGKVSNWWGWIIGVTLWLICEKLKLAVPPFPSSTLLYYRLLFLLQNWNKKNLNNIILLVNTTCIEEWKYSFNFYIPPPDINGAEFPFLVSFCGCFFARREFQGVNMLKLRGVGNQWLANLYSGHNEFRDDSCRVPVWDCFLRVYFEYRNSSIQRLARFLVSVLSQSHLKSLNMVGLVFYGK